MSALQRKLMKKGLPPLPPAGFQTASKKPRRDYSPLPWSDFFDHCRDVSVGTSSFRVYEKGDSGPVLLLLHGGGHSGLSWAVFAVAISKLVNCRIVALDLRGHGHTVTDDDENLSNETLISDVENVVNALYKDEAPPTVLMGHSMGGAIAVRVAAAGVIPVLVGLAVIDVVEGTAIESLGSMQSFLRGRPSSFKSIEHAIEWSIRSGQLKNTTSARVSMPGQIKRSDKSISVNVQSIDQQQPVSLPGRVPQSIQEEDEESEECSSTTASKQEAAKPSDDHPQSSSNTSTTYSWRIDLTKTEPFWSQWFTGLSKLFASTSVPKMLILAGVDRLDKELTIAQMQGKFQMVVLSGCGHSVHEDTPDKVAEVITGFFLRQKLATAKDQFERQFPAC